MDLPFSRAQFFEVFARYNTAVWPAQLVLLGIAGACVVALFFRRRAKAIPFALALLWAWMAIAYHFAFFAAINPAAWGFGGLFLVQATLLVWHSSRSTLRFDLPAARLERAVGATLVSYALAGYPVVGLLSQHSIVEMPTFGLPCPTTIFTLGMLLLAQRPVPKTLFIIPILWSIVGSMAATELGVVQDYGLGLAAIAALTVLVIRARGTRRSAVAH